MNAAAKRAALDSFCDLAISVEELAARYPNCGCESAATVDGSPGPVTKDEVLRLFLTSPSDIDGKRREQREKRPFKKASLQKIFTKGLSVVRMRHAAPSEIEYSASILFAYQSGRDPVHGGILSVVDFPVAAVREDADAVSLMCVLETPLERQASGEFLRPSHGDVVNSASGLSEEARLAKRDVAYNRIVELGKQSNVEQVSDSNLAQFLPQIVAAAGRA